MIEDSSSIVVFLWNVLIPQPRSETWVVKDSFVHWQPRDYEVT